MFRPVVGDGAVVADGCGNLRSGLRCRRLFTLFASAMVPQRAMHADRKMICLSFILVMLEVRQNHLIRVKNMVLSMARAVRKESPHESEPASGVEDCEKNFVIPDKVEYGHYEEVCRYVCYHRVFTPAHPKECCRPLGS